MAMWDVQEKRPSTATVSSVPVSTASVTLMEANAERLGAIITNSGTPNMYLKLGINATITSFSVKIQTDAVYELQFPCYNGIVSCIWDDSDVDGFALATEVI